jgi:hypothetical protein
VVITKFLHRISALLGVLNFHWCKNLEDMNISNASIRKIGGIKKIIEFIKNNN